MPCTIRTMNKAQAKNTWRIALIKKIAKRVSRLNSFKPLVLLSRKNTIGMKRTPIIITMIQLIMLKYLQFFFDLSGPIKSSFTFILLVTYTYIKYWHICLFWKRSTFLLLAYYLPNLRSRFLYSFTMLFKSWSLNSGQSLFLKKNSEYIVFDGKNPEILFSFPLLNNISISFWILW